VELFEILFILFFILIPILEGLRKKRQGPAPEDADTADRPARPGRSPYEEPAGPPPPRPEPELDTSGAADMVPDDLWEVLTGERRVRTEPAEDQVDEPEEYSTWRDVPAWEPEPEPEPEPEDEWPEPTPWLEDAESPVAQTAEPAAPHQHAMTFSPRAADEGRGTLGSPIGEPDAPPRRSRLTDSLRSSQGLRRAVLLKEILGRPKGLDF
jgi:hypothetical protein